MKQDHDIQPEFSRIVALDRLGDDEESHEIEAGARERAALAERFGLLKLDTFAASVRLKRVQGGAVRASGSFSADVVQSCVVTLEPVASHLSETFSVVYSPNLARADRVAVIVFLDDEETPEPLVGNALDIGEMVAQYLALSLDPYPRAPRARFEGRYPTPGEEQESGAGDEGPFAALAALRKKAKH